MIYPHPHPPNTTPLHSTSKVEGLTQPVIGQCTHIIYLTDIDRLEGGSSEREREGGKEKEVGKQGERGKEEEREWRWRKGIDGQKKRTTKC